MFLQKYLKVKYDQKLFNLQIKLLLNDAEIHTIRVMVDIRSGARDAGTREDIRSGAQDLMAETPLSYAKTLLL